MSRSGAVPLDPHTDVGRLRLLLDDVEWVPLDPPESGMGSYGRFSDDALSVYLSLAGSVTAAAALAGAPTSNRWYSTWNDAAVERLVAAWPDAPIENEEVMQMILETAKQQVIAFGDPADTTEQTEVNQDGYLVTSTTPARWVYAQLQQAKNLWNAGRVNSAGNTGMDTYSFTPRPLDKTIRSIIRPQGVPNVV